MMNKPLLFILLICLLSSCNPKKQKNDLIDPFAENCIELCWRDLVIGHANGEDVANFIDNNADVVFNIATDETKNHATINLNYRKAGNLLIFRLTENILQSISFRGEFETDIHDILDMYQAPHNILLVEHSYPNGDSHLSIYFFYPNEGFIFEFYTEDYTSHRQLCITEKARLVSINATVSSDSLRSLMRNSAYDRTTMYFVLHHNTLWQGFTCYDQFMSL